MRIPIFLKWMRKDGELLPEKKQMKRQKKSRKKKNQVHIGKEKTGYAGWNGI